MFLQSKKQGPFTQNFAKQPYVFFVPKVLRIIFYPLKHPSQAQKCKNELKGNFFWDTLYMPLYHKEKFKIKGLKINWDELDLVSLLTITLF